MLAPNFGAMPHGLTKHARWLLWRLVWDPDADRGAGRWTKVPYRADGRGKASTTNPDTWTTFDAARAAYEHGELEADGVGFVVGEGIVGGDVDGCRDPVTGELTADAAAIIAEMRTYAEVSPSGTGVRYFALGALPAAGRKRGPFEMYDGDGGRYLTVTGHQLDGTPDEIEARDAELAAVHARHVAAPPRPDRNGEHHGPRPTPTGAGAHLSDTEVLERMKRAKLAAAALYDGDTSAHGGDHSAADLALCSHLAFWCDYDAAQVDRLFRASALMRPKWTRRVSSDGELYGERTIRTVMDGKRPGDGYRPRSAQVAPPPARDPSNPGPSDADVPADPDAHPEPTATRLEVRDDGLVAQADGELALYADTDLGNSERLVHRCRNLLRYAPGIGWLLWKRTHWEADGDRELVLRFASATMRATVATAELLEDGERRKSLRHHARASEALGRLRAMVELARVHRDVHIPATALDADPWRLNVANGLLNLTDGTLEPHNPDALCTRMAPTRYDLDAQHPALDALLEVLARDGRAEYLRAIAGQALTGRSAKAIYIWTGPTGTVKSTTADALAAVLGPDYAVPVEPSTLLVSRHGNSPGGARADLVALRGARLAIAAELPNGGRLDGELVKRLTGRDPITARAPYAREVLTFIPGHTLVVHSNHDPRIDWTDDGMRHRVVPVPFTVRPDNPDPRIRAALVEDPDARAAVLAWAIAGAVTWHRNGEREPDPPELVRRRKVEYLREQDPFAAWADDALEATGDTTIFTATAAIAEDYRRWCEANGERPLGTKALGAWLRDNAEALGITATRGSTPGGPRGRGWAGLRLRDGGRP